MLGLKTHDYVLLFIQGSSSEFASPLEKDMWIRCERGPDTKSNRAMLSLQNPNAEDTITLSFEKNSVWGKNHNPTGLVLHRRATFRHLLELLQIISDVCGSYGLASSNCWWFAKVVFSTLDVFNGGQTIIAPQSSFAQEVIKALGRDMEAQTKKVGERFAALYQDPLLSDSPAPINNPLPPEFPSDESDGRSSFDPIAPLASFSVQPYGSSPPPIVTRRSGSTSSDPRRPTIAVPPFIPDPSLASPVSSTSSGRPPLSVVTSAPPGVHRQTSVFGRALDVISSRRKQTSATAKSPSIASGPMGPWSFVPVVRLRPSIWFNGCLTRTCTGKRHIPYCLRIVSSRYTELWYIVTVFWVFCDTDFVWYFFQILCVEILTACPNRSPYLRTLRLALMLS